MPKNPRKLKEKDVSSTVIAAIQNVRPMRQRELDSLQMNKISEHRSSVARKMGNSMV